MKLFFDTETSGKADYKAPAQAPHQPRIVKLAAALVEDNGDYISSMEVMVCPPDGLVFQDEARSKHGITEERARRCGVPAKTAVSTFCHLLKVAGQAWAYNIQFDRLVMEHEFSLAYGRTDLFDKFECHCEMLAMKDVCKFPSRFKSGDYKCPSLQEAHEFAFGQGFEGSHDAMVDVRAMLRVHKWRMTEWAERQKELASERQPL